MVELRKRPAPAAAPPPPPKRKASSSAPAKPKPSAAQSINKTVKKAKNAVAAAVTGDSAAETAPASASAPAADPAPPASEAAAAAPAEPVVAPAAAPVAQTTGLSVGSPLALEGFGGEVKTNEGDATTLKQLVEKSERGVVIFTYPKASTPGCTTQACLFRDNYTSLTAAGLSVYGLSTDSPTANTTFKTKQKLPYALLCDPTASLIAALGFKKSPKGTVRGVVVVDKNGKVLAAQPGGPAATLEVVQKLVQAGL